MRRLAVALALLAVAPLARAQSLVAWPLNQAHIWRPFLPHMPVRPPVPHPQPQPNQPPRDVSTPLELSDYMIDGKVTNGAAELTYSMTFRNPTSQRLEGILFMPLPEGVVVEKFAMTVGGKEQKGELLDAGRAAQIYDSIVHQRRDPGLLELVGERGLRARVFPIEPNGQIAIRINMTQVLRRDNNVSSMTLPIRAAQTTQGGGGRVRARLALTADAPLRTVFSPNAAAKVERRGEREAILTLDAPNPEAAGDLSLVFSTGRDALAPSLVTFRDADEDGYFMLSLTPRAEAGAPVKAAPKDVVFIVDRSGSMEDGGKMDQARKALLYCLERLHEGDRFGIVDFATDSQQLAPRMLNATAENKARAKRYVERIEAAGGTNIEAGLNDGLRLLGDESGGRAAMVFFMTDGLPTQGNTNVDALLKLAAERGAGRKARLFAFGVGSDVNTLLLDKLADGNGGARDYVAPGEDIEAKVSTLYQKVSRPALTDVSIEWEGVDGLAVYPRPIRDLFYGSELALVGRYAGSGRGKLIVRGTMAGQKRVFEYPLEWPKQAEDAKYLPRVWASRKISAELDGIRLSGRADPEVIQEIVRLAKRHGIVTPYTSYLIVEEGMNIQQANRMAMDSAVAMVRGASESGFSGGRGLAKRAQKASMYLGAMSGAAAAPAAQPVAMMEADALAEAKKELADRGARIVATRSLAGKTFYKRGSTWVDGDAELLENAAREKVKYLSERWTALASDARTARWLSLGERVTLAVGGKVYEIEP